MTRDDCKVKELGHTSEIGLRLRAVSPKVLFACAARAMFDLVVSEDDQPSPAASRTVSIESIDVESLMVDWLSELLYLYETTGAVVVSCDVAKWSPNEMTATVHNARPNRPPRMHIKAVTYHQLQVKPVQDGWLATLIFDI